jgi:hypothetical protein
MKTLKKSEVFRRPAGSLPFGKRVPVVCTTGYNSDNPSGLRIGNDSHSAL